MIGKAFAPGHITGFFEIRDRPSDPLRRGSRGAGVNLSLGAVTTVEAGRAGRASIDIRLGGRRARAETTRLALEGLLGRRRLRVRAKSELQLPVGRGLGMSAAGALSASLALSSALGLPPTDPRAVRAAHSAEVRARTGLGDVAGQLCGGWEVRVGPGLPPFGRVERLRAPVMPLALCVLGGPVPTRGVLSDPARRRLINRVGGACMEGILRRPTIRSFFSLSRRFARQTGLASEESLGLVDDIYERRLGQAGVSMIGDSVFAVGDIKGLLDLMRGHGRTFVCETDPRGARAVA